MRIPFLLALLLFSACSGAKKLSVATEGEVAQNAFTKTISFDYATKHLFIDVEIAGKTYNFLFDTGWDVTSISKELGETLDIKTVAKQTVTGSSMEKHKTRFGFLPSLTIAEIDFQNIGVGMEDLSFITSTRSDGKKVDGVIGANVIKKLYWQIDYSNKTIQFSDQLKHLSIGDNAYQIPMIRKSTYNWGANKIEVDLNNHPEQFIFDTGSSGGFTGNFQLYERLKSNDPSIEMNRQSVNIANLSLDTLKLKNTSLSIEKGVSLLIGNDFLEHYLVTMDSDKNILYLVPNNSN
ncbi:MAG: retropepsin-like aspartic protease [Bacteroidota bacterium]